MPAQPQQHLEVLQANINHSARAQDLLIQHMVEWSVGLAAVGEPYYVPPVPNWAGDTEGLVAVVASTAGRTPPLSRIGSGPGYVAAKWGDTVWIAVYFSPNRPLREFARYLERLGRLVGGLAPTPVVVLGDLNAKAEAWGSPATTPRGETLWDWAVALGLEVQNQGSTDTCVRRQGGSIVDVTFATPAVAARISCWRVLEGVETLSDHRYIRMRVSPRGAAQAPARAARGGGRFPRWSLVHLDREVAEEAAMWEAWGLPDVDPTEGVAERALDFRATMGRVCDAAMPRAKTLPGKKQVYWWTEEIAALRATSNAARRAYVRHRRLRRRNPGRHEEAEEGRLYGALKTAKEALSGAIGRAKDSAHEEFLASLDRDPWGRPYKMVRDKLRRASAPPTDSLEPEVLTRIVEGLFPEAPHMVPPRMSCPSEEPQEELEVPPVTDVEFHWVVTRLRACKKAPGPDGVPGRVLPVALKHLGTRLRQLFDDCLRSGIFPGCWKEGRLCLLRKESRPADSPSGWRPIVLLDETGKMLERVISSRIVERLEGEGPNLSEHQHGFRRQRSCMDALGALRAFVEGAEERGEGVVAVSLDIANAFGSLPYPVIVEALRYHGVPLYLRRLVEHYLSARVVLYQTRDDGWREREMSAGVPQGSVLGPLLWNIGYDWAIRLALLPRMTVICYADDTLVAVRGKRLEEVLRRAAVASDLMVHRISLLGLRVSLPKTEAIVFGGRGWRPPPGAALRVASETVEVRPHIKYLGLTLDRRLDFGEHFRRLAPRVTKAAAALGRLLPNIGGPKAPCRRLYAGVAKSMALYGAPIWADKLGPKNKALLRRPQRVVAQRMVRAYVTVAWAAACALAGSLPWELEAQVLAEVHDRRRRSREEGVEPCPEVVEGWRRQAKERMRDRWKGDLEDSPYGVRTIGALLPSLDPWLDRGHGVVGYHLAQVLTGHGCFGQYLCKIGREPDPRCHECGDPEDSAIHTVEFCPRWEPERRTMVAGLGTGDLSLHSVVTAMLRGETHWEVAATFCETIISQKEAAEREREDDPNAHPLRRRRRGRRRAQFARQIPL